MRPEPADLAAQLQPVALAVQVGKCRFSQADQCLLGSYAASAAVAEAVAQAVPAATAEK